MRLPAALLALTLLAAVTPAVAADAPAPQAAGEPLPPGAPTDDYELTAWCYGALSEYLDIYEKVKPDLRAIDKMFGSSVKNESEPYADDMAAARVEQKALAGAVVAAEKASPQPIAARGAAALNQGRAIWGPAEEKTRRELARAWLSWALPDRCASTGKELAAKSALLGEALKYNTASALDAPAQTPVQAKPNP